MPLQVLSKLSLPRSRLGNSDCPFRAIVSEKATWQAQVGQYLQRHLRLLPLQDPFLVRSSDEVVQLLEDGRWNGVHAFSLDVVDLYYSVPHDELFSALRDKIDDFGELKFNGKTGVSSDSFLELVHFYLQSTVVEFEDKFYVQRRGICIGSSLAPIFSDIYLSAFDKSVKTKLADAHHITVLRYVDDYLVVVNQVAGTSLNDVVIGVIETFVSSSKSLKFTWELPSNNCLRFLDLILTFQNTHVCWQYKPRANKQLIPFDSAHSK
ncbi:hypothetical protein HPB48_002850 [Haemaphysalis longicornis]|uniref:Reverse transcriptase domain-containing protein n=1 Tax=Haemaphysalis longicornis TaxID=44386 RepID=A0A9J6GUX2_HAELO|nr:hypothetical protein HPB48_002850 [Haemaphysalis longicornis]